MDLTGAFMLPPTAARTPHGKAKPSGGANARLVFRPVPLISDPCAPGS